MLSTNLVACLAVGGLAAMGTMANEGTHGGLAEMMGLGHHHMADYGGYHCTANDGEAGAEHMQHMHGDQPIDHADCPGGADMHRMAPMGPMGGA